MRREPVWIKDWASAVVETDADPFAGLGKVVGPRGFSPPSSESESGALELSYEPIAEEYLGVLGHLAGGGDPEVFAALAAHW